MATGTITATREAEVRAVIDEWAHALRAKDVDGVTSHYAPDVVQFDMAPPLKTAGGKPAQDKLEGVEDRACA